MFHTDSSVVLGYVNNDAWRFHTYVGNRVQHIRDRYHIRETEPVIQHKPKPYSTHTRNRISNSTQTETVFNTYAKPNQWHYIASGENPAPDKPSRGRTSKELLENAQWFIVFFILCGNENPFSQIQSQLPNYNQGISK